MPRRCQGSGRTRPRKRYLSSAFQIRRSKKRPARRRSCVGRPCAYSARNSFPITKKGPAPNFGVGPLDEPAALRSEGRELVAWPVRQISRTRPTRKSRPHSLTYGQLNATRLLIASNTFLASTCVAFTWPYQTASADVRLASRVRQYLRDAQAGCAAESTAAVQEGPGARRRAARSVNHAADVSEIDLHDADWPRRADLVPAERWVTKVHVQCRRQHLWLQHCVTRTSRLQVAALITLYT